MSVWTEARLFEENVENIQSLATAPIEQLVLRTHFSTTQIVDWIDQAILYIHAGHNGEWFPYFRAVGIRTASDLLGNVGFILPHSKNRPNLSGMEMARVIEAVEAAQAARTAGTPAEKARKLTAELLKTVDSAADIAAAQYQLIQSITAGIPRSYDNVTALKQDVQAAGEQAASAESLIPDILGASSTVLDADGQQKANQRIADATAALKQAHTSAETASKLSAAMMFQPNTLNSLGTLQGEIAAWDTRVGEALKAIEQLVSTLAEAGNTRTEIVEALERAKQAQDRLKGAQTAAQKAHGRAKQLDATRPETLDARAQLRAQLVRLSAQAKSLVDQHTKLANEAPAIAQTEEQRFEIDTTLAEARRAIDGLDNPVQQASKAVNALSAEQELPETLPIAQKTIEQLYHANQSARDAAHAAIFAVRASALPRQLSMPILEQICHAMWPDPNVAYVLNFYKNYGNPGTQA